MTQWSAQRVRAVLRSQPVLDPTVRALVTKALERDLVPAFVPVAQFSVRDLRNSFLIRQETSLDVRTEMPGIGPFIAALANTLRPALDVITLDVDGAELLCICDPVTGLMLSALSVPRGSFKLGWRDPD